MKDLQADFQESKNKDDSIMMKAMHVRSTTTDARS